MPDRTGRAPRARGPRPAGSATTDWHRRPPNRSRPAQRGQPPAAESPPPRRTACAGSRGGPPRRPAPRPAPRHSAPHSTAKPPPCCKPVRAPAIGRGTTTGSGRTTTEPPPDARRPPAAPAHRLPHRYAAPIGPPWAPRTRRAPKGRHPSGVDRRDQPHRRQRVPAQIEERVIDPDPLQTQDLGVDAGQDLLGRAVGAR